MQITKGIGLALASLVLIVAVILGGWQAGWWFKVQNTKRQGQIINIQGHNIRQSYGNQQTLRDQITSKIGDVLNISSEIAGIRDQGEIDTLKSQRKAIVSIICNDAEQVTGDPLAPDQQRFVAQNCEAGSVSPSSPYNQ